MGNIMNNSNASAFKITFVTKVSMEVWILTLWPGELWSSDSSEKLFLRKHLDMLVFFVKYDAVLRLYVCI